MQQTRHESDTGAERGATAGVPGGCSDQGSRSCADTRADSRTARRDRPGRGSIGALRCELTTYCVMLLEKSEALAARRQGHHGR